MGKDVQPLQSVKTDISAVLTVKSGLNPHMIIILEDDLNYGGYIILDLILTLYLWVNGIYLYLVKLANKI